MLGQIWIDVAFAWSAQSRHIKEGFFHENLLSWPSRARGCHCPGEDISWWFWTEGLFHAFAKLPKKSPGQRPGFSSSVLIKVQPLIPPYLLKTYFLSYQKIGISRSSGWLGARRALGLNSSGSVGFGKPSYLDTLLLLQSAYLAPQFHNSFPPLAFFSCFHSCSKEPKPTEAKHSRSRFPTVNSYI